MKVLTQASDLARVALEGLAFLAAGVLVGGAIAAGVKRGILGRTGSAPPVRRVVGSVALEALFMSVIFYSFPAFVDPRGSLVRPVLVGLALYALLATALNVRWFFKRAVRSPHGLRDIAMAALIGMISLFIIVTVTIALRVLVGWMFGL